MNMRNASVRLLDLKVGLELLSFSQSYLDQKRVRPRRYRTAPRATKLRGNAIPKLFRPPVAHQLHLSLCRLAGEIQRQVGPRDYPGRHETLSLGQTRADRTGQVDRVDNDDQLRQPVFLELRTDKKAKDVVRQADKMLRL